MTARLATTGPDRLTFDREKHEYFLGGRRVPNVTTILGPLTDLSAIPRDVLEHKRQIGQAVHRAIELDLQDDLDTSTVAPEIAGYLDGWQKYRREREYEHFASERRVAHRRYRYAGTLDLFGNALRMVKPGSLKRVLVLSDLKTVHEVTAPTRLQTAAYLGALESEDGPGATKGTNRLALQLKPDGTYKEHWFDDPTDWPVFLNFLQCHNWKSAHC